MPNLLLERITGDLDDRGPDEQGCTAISFIRAVPTPVSRLAVQPDLLDTLCKVSILSQLVT